MTYGCGASDCVSCYPFTYRCAVCRVDFPEPVPNGASDPTCQNCEWDGESYNPLAKDADGFCLECGEPHEAESCPIYVNAR